MKKINLLLIFIFLLLVSPYVILAFAFFFLNGSSGSIGLPTGAMKVFGFTALQAFLSAIFSLILGTAGSFGLLGLRRNLKARTGSQRSLELFILLPNLLPVLFILLALMNLFPSLHGLSGIVIVHTFINIGLVAVIFEHLLRERAGKYLELARVEGASRLRMITKVILPLLKTEIALLALTVFSLCFSSFAVPLIIGGSRATTTEVLIYELIRIDLNLAHALIISFFQTLIVLGLSLVVRGVAVPQTSGVRNIEFLGVPALAFLVVLPPTFLMIGMFDGVVDGFAQLTREVQMNGLLLLALNSFLISVFTAALTLLLLVLIAFAQPEGILRKATLGLVAPSSILTGFALILIWRSIGFASIIKIAIGLSLIFVPILYRLGWDAKLLEIKGQISTAKVLGASRWLTFQKVLWPQLQGTAARLAALASFWAWGDFALSKMVAERTLSFSMLIQALMSSYRLNSATALLWILLLASALTYLLVWGVVNVSRRKSTR